MSTGPRRRPEARERNSTKKARWETRGVAGGYMDDDVMHRGDVPIVREACKSLVNWTIAAKGVARRRPGSFMRRKITGDRIERISVAGGLKRTLVFSANTISIVDESDWSEEDSLANGHSLSIRQRLQVRSFDSFVHVAGPSLSPFTLTRDGSGTWTYADVSFDEGGDGQIFQPYFRYAPLGVDLTPSGLSGSITVELGPGAQDYLDALHDEVVLRLDGRPMRLTAITDGDTATATVLQTQGLHPADTITVASGEPDKFAVGDVVLGETTGAEAFISEKVSATQMRVTYRAYDRFDASERIVGPNGAATLTARVNYATPFALTVWDEAMMSPAKGYPRALSVHKGRLYYGGFLSAPSWYAASRVGSPFNHDTGTGQINEAIVDQLGGEESDIIRYMVSARQHIFLTQNGVWNSRESQEQPFGPGFTDVDKFSTAPCADCHPCVTDEGVVWGYESSVFAAQPTGRNQPSSWAVSDINEMSRDYIRDPLVCAQSDGLMNSSSDSETEKGRFLFVINEDYTLAVAYKSRNDDRIAWSRWQVRNGPDNATPAENVGNRFKWVATRGSSALVVFTPEETGSADFLCEFDFDALLDGQVTYSSAITDYANLTGLTLIGLNSSVGEGFIATGQMNASGEFVRDDNSQTVTPSANYAVGWDFESELIPRPPIDPENGSATVIVNEVRPRLLKTQYLEAQRVFPDGTEVEPINSADGQTDDSSSAFQKRSWTPDGIMVANSGEDDAVEPEIKFVQTRAYHAQIASFNWSVEYGFG